MRLLVRSFPLAALTLASASFGQGLLTQKSLSNDAVIKVAQGALEKCNSQGYKISLSILDASGAVKLQIRGDGTGPHTLEHSRRKAYTALTFKRTSAETAEAWAKRGGDWSGWRKWCARWREG
jgi:uncharacterized protein GlcG (DUF336 family)